MYIVVKLSCSWFIPERHAPRHAFACLQSMVSEQPERFFVAELIREKIFLLYSQEVPYSTQVRNGQGVGWASDWSACCCTVRR